MKLIILVRSYFLDITVYNSEYFKAKARKQTVKDYEKIASDLDYSKWFCILNNFKITS